MADATEHTGAPGSVRRERSASAQAAVTAGVGGAALVAGSSVYAVVAAGQTTSIGQAVALIASPQLLAWIVLVVGVGLLARRASPLALAIWAVVLAPVATSTAALLPFRPAVAAVGTWWILLAWQAAGLFGAAVIGALAGHAFGRGAVIGRRSTMAAASGILLAVGGTLAFALPMIWFQTYFSIWEPAPPPSPEQIGRYEFAAAAALLLIAASFAVALVARRRGLAWLTGVALLLALAAAFVFQIPAGRFVPERVAPEPYNTTVCFGTSGDCPGG